MPCALASLFVLLLLLVGCQPPTKEQQNSSPAKSAVPAPIAAASPAAPPPARPPATPARLVYEVFQATADTSFQANGQRYYLALRVRLDTLQVLKHHTAHDTSSGYQGYYAFTIRDSLRRLVSQRTLRKQDFYPAIGPGLALASTTNLPTLLG